MKPVLLQITSTPSHSFLVRKDSGKNLISNWHYHPEMELLLLKKGSGSWIVGDHVGYFQDGDVVVMGSNLPHSFRHEIETADTAPGESICVKFSPLILGAHFLNLPEARQIKLLLERPGYGFTLSGPVKQQVAAAIEQLPDQTPGKRLATLVTILEEISEIENHHVLSSKGIYESMDIDRGRIKVIFDYTFHHYTEKITLGKVAGLVNMTRESFCRFFKSKTRKTYTQFLMELRIGSACRLLVEADKNVGEIAFACGYENFSHFGHQFKFITGKSALEFKRNYLKRGAVAVDA